MNQNTRIAYYTMGSMAIAYALLGGITLKFSVPTLLALGAGSYHLILSAIFFLAWLVGFKKLARWPLLIGLAVFCVDGVVMFRSLLEVHHLGIVGPFVVWVFVASHWLRGLRENSTP